MAKKKSTKTEAALRREVEALKAQLKEYGIEPTDSGNHLDEQAGMQLDLKKVRATRSIPLGDTTISNESSEEILKHYSDADYLIKDMKKTAMISVIVIILVVALKVSNVLSLIIH